MSTDANIAIALAALELLEGKSFRSRLDLSSKSPKGRGKYIAKAFTNKGRYQCESILEIDIICWASCHNIWSIGRTHWLYGLLISWVFCFVVETLESTAYQNSGVHDSKHEDFLTAYFSVLVSTQKLIIHPGNASRNYQSLTQSSIFIVELSNRSGKREERQEKQNW